MTDRERELTFSFLDDLAFAAARGRARASHYVRSARIGRLGPFLELVALDRCGQLPLDALPATAVKRTLYSALHVAQPGRGDFAEWYGTRLGFIRTCRDPEAEDQVHWTAFCRRAQDAAELSLPKPIAQGLVGAMREIEDNIHVHSQRAADGIVGFRGTADEFEFGVLDSGIGVLKSLRQSPDYRDLNDSGSAIRLALSDGHSRLRHVDSGRGHGFHDLFVGLANLTGKLRFRSDDHALTINGTSPTLVAAKLDQKVDLPGFFVNVVCRFTASTLQ